MKRSLIAFIVFISLTAYCDETIRIATFNCEFLNMRKLHMKFGHPIH